ncbi:MAG: pyridoxal phosphate-dependent aminotransferase [Acidobacteria bacterium]|nr:pyridoxal phosphate-dependent aminotransferase [Acidobacteriota bacterium]
MDAVQPPIVPFVAELIRQSPGTISLGQGVVHYGPPAAAADAVREALARPETHDYGDGLGTPALVAAIAGKLRRENGIDVDRGWRLMVTAGANMAFTHAVTAITAPGDEIILNVPFYFNHEMAVQMAGCTPVRVATDERYQLRPDALRRAITDRTRAIVTVSPNNPSGAVLSEASLHEVDALCAERGLYHIVDEVYEYFTYGPAAHVSPGSFAGAAARTIAIYSLSKAYGMAGWRVGYVAYPEHLADAMSKIQDTTLICAPIASQAAALAALSAGRAHCAPHVRALAEVRQIVLARLAELGPIATVPAADGAFYVLLRVHTDMDPLALAERLIREHRVAVIPGSAFGMTGGCYFRVAYGALQKDTVAEGIGRLVGGLRAIVA